MGPFVPSGSPDLSGCFIKFCCFLSFGRFPGVLILCADVSEQSVRTRRKSSFFMFFLTVHHSIDLFHLPTLIHNSFIRLTICILHYNPRHVSSINMPIFRRTNCTITASGIVTLCTVQYSMPDESRLQSIRHTVQPFTDRKSVV